MNQSVEAEALHSAQWWQSRTNDELHELMRGGLEHGEDGLGAHREIERRAREHAREEEREAELATARKKALRLKILAGVLLAVLIAIAATMLIR